MKSEDSTLKESFPNRPKRIIPSLIKYEKQMMSDTVKYQNQKREVCTKLVFTQTRGLKFVEVVRQGLLQTFKTFKTVKEITFVLSQVSNHDSESLKALKKCFYARFPSLNSINLILAQGCNKSNALTEPSFRSINTLIQILKRHVSLKRINLNLNICQTLNSSISKNLLSALKRFPDLEKLHLNLFPTCQGLHPPCIDEYTKSIADFLQKQPHLKDLELDLSSANEMPDKLFKYFMTSVQDLKSLKRFKFHLRGYILLKYLTDPKASIDARSQAEKILHSSPKT